MKFISKFLSVLTVVLFFGFFTVNSALAVNFNLSGNVQDSSGTAIINATVDVKNTSNNTIIATTTTDNSGNYNVSVASGTYNV